MSAILSLLKSGVKDSFLLFYTCSLNFLSYFSDFSNCSARQFFSCRVSFKNLFSYSLFLLRANICFSYCCTLSSQLAFTASASCFACLALPVSSSFSANILLHFCSHSASLFASTPFYSFSLSHYFPWLSPILPFSSSKVCFLRYSSFPRESFYYSSVMHLFSSSSTFPPCWFSRTLCSRFKSCPFCDIPSLLTSCTCTSLLLSVYFLLPSSSASSFFRDSSWLCFCCPCGSFLFSTFA